ncbi:hypothetical protein Pla108_29980 [Botrimarina colliarenosi]|uniref:Ice-binding protein C-terminal domain-containing protein n=1 Tax=Botrimarina colliarenosi TaxID=2528001 RepID=A0A5C6AA59_9BACT|nr:PEP-CTERM sorting domain-containing protein [Botrimarina colliarenosi]TWT95921.1 hypothetical protein Pla108_29980 [Botrimarina colliarenosi]
MIVPPLSRLALLLTLAAPLVAASVAASPASAAPVVLYSETFTGQAGKGFQAGVTDLAGVDWTLNTSEVSATADFAVDGGEAFVATDIEGKGVFFTPSIDISGYTDITVSVAAFQTGDIAAADYFDLRYRVDMAPISLVADWMGMGSASHTLNGNTVGADWGTTVVEQIVSEGTSLQLTLTVRNNFEAAPTSIGFDSILVTGRLASIPEPTATCLVALAMAGVVIRRRAS